MTNEEALKILKDEIKRIEYFKKECNSCIPDNVIEAYHIVLKNLEVLDILKDYFQYNDYDQWYIDMQESDFDFRSECTKEEWMNSPQKKIKDWLRRIK